MTDTLEQQKIAQPFSIESARAKDVGVPYQRFIRMALEKAVQG